MMPTQHVRGPYLTVADSLAPLPINTNNKKNFQAISNCGKQKRSSQIFREVSGVFRQDFNCTKIMLSSSRGQGNFRGLGFRGLDQGQGQGLQNVSSRSRMSSRTSPLVSPFLIYWLHWQTQSHNNEFATYTNNWPGDKHYCIQSRSQDFAKGGGGFFGGLIQP